MSITTSMTSVAVALTALSCAQPASPARSGSATPAATTTAEAPPAPVPMHQHLAGPADPQPPVARDAPPSVFTDPGARDPAPVREAVAILHPTRGNTTQGIVRFVETPAGLDVLANVSALPGGRHAYHVHVYGDCSSPDAKSAGPHFHFTGSSLDREVKIITGNLGDLEGDARHAATQRARIPDATLQGPYSLLGRAVVIHAKPNDPSQPPDGGAGDRIACGVIGVASAPPPSSAGT